MEHDIKITAGLGSVEDFEAFVKSGAEELFCGYVPFKWNQKFGNILPANRREVLFYHVNICTLEEMKILKKMSEYYNVPVSVTFNALYYTQLQLEMLRKIISELVEIGFQDFIVADIGLILFLKKYKIPCRLHISGELGEVNTGTMKLLHQQICNDTDGGPEIVRWIFHRKQSLDEIKTCIKYGKRINPKMEFEAFFLNEMCHFAGGFCNSMHCDEMVHLCQMPYELVRWDGEANDKMLSRWRKVQEEKEYLDVIGESGCGLCALWKMREIGITHLKVVGRGKSVQCMEADIKSVNKAIQILGGIESAEDYKKEMLELLFQKKCSGNCYYREV